VVNGNLTRDARPQSRGSSVVGGRVALQLDGFGTPESPLYQGEGFVAVHGCRIVAGLDGQTGAQDTDAVDRRFSGDLGGLAGEAETRTATR